jgi:NAD(P)-dependent dehydrogenase (short-subunit alcohol dehydrogenase family)
MSNIAIIGASSGIGLALAQQLAQAGHQVYGTYCKTQPTAQDNIQWQLLDVLADELDFSEFPSTVDALVYCPGSIKLKSFARTPAADFEADYRLQVLGAIRCIQGLLPNLKQSEQGSICLFSSVAAQLGMNFHSVVGTHKAAIEGLCKSLAAELAPKIRVNAIAPSLTATPLSQGLLSTPEKVEASAKRHPLQQIGQAEDIAQLAAFLIGPSAKFITGQIIHADGGLMDIKI